jgi:hypothetical protein
VPPSGVLATVEREAAITRPFKMAQRVHTAKRSPAVTMRRHVVHSRSVSRRQTITRVTTVDQSIAPNLSVVSTAAEQPRDDGIGYDSLSIPIRKGKRGEIAIFPIAACLPTQAKALPPGLVHRARAVALILHPDGVVDFRVLFSSAGQSFWVAYPMAALPQAPMPTTLGVSTHICTESGGSDDEEGSACLPWLGRGMPDQLMTPIA